MGNTEIKYWPNLIKQIRCDNPAYAIYMHQCPMCMHSLIKNTDGEITCDGYSLRYKYKGANHYPKELAIHEVTTMLCENIPAKYINYK